MKTVLQKNISPRFEFGFGLSYTNFEYSGLHLERTAFAEGESGGDIELVKAWERGEATPMVEGISRAFWLHKPAYEVGFWVKNVGKVFGGEVSDPNYFSLLFLLIKAFFRVRSHNCMSTSRAPLVNPRRSFVDLRTRRSTLVKGSG